MKPHQKLLLAIEKLANWARDFETIDTIPEGLCPSCHNTLDPDKGVCQTCGVPIGKQDEQFLQPNRLDVKPTGAQRAVMIPDSLRSRLETQDIVKEKFKGYY